LNRYGLIGNKSTVLVGFVACRTAIVASGFDSRGSKAPEWILMDRDWSWADSCIATHRGREIRYRALVHARIDHHIDAYSLQDPG
jgi:hypothetical protein